MTESTMIQEKSGNGSYEFDGRVRYSEIDHRGTMTLPAPDQLFSGLQYVSLRSGRSRHGQAET